MGKGDREYRQQIRDGNAEPYRKVAAVRRLQNAMESVRREWGDNALNRYLLKNMEPEA